MVTTTTVFSGSAWIPSSNNDWNSESIDLNNYANEDDFVIKFRNITDYENNLFLDNINVTLDGSTYIDEKNKKAVDVYPNPTNKYVNVNYDGLKQIFTILGEKLFETNENIINVSSLSKGVYVIRLENMTMRFIKE